MPADLSGHCEMMDFYYSEPEGVIASTDTPTVVES